MLRTALPDDARPTYTQISQALDIPIGSMGPTRARCLDRMRNSWEHHAGAR
jgi:hypothetical protein